MQTYEVKCLSECVLLPLNFQWFEIDEQRKSHSSRVLDLRLVSSQGGKFSFALGRPRLLKLLFTFIAAS